MTKKSQLKSRLEANLASRDPVRNPASLCKEVEAGKLASTGASSTLFGIFKKILVGNIFYVNRPNLIAVRLQHSHCRLKIRRASLPGFQSQPRQGVLKRGKVLSDHFSWEKTVVAKMYHSNLVRRLNQELHQVLPSPGLLAI